MSRVARFLHVLVARTNPRFDRLAINPKQIFPHLLLSAVLAQSLTRLAYCQELLMNTLLAKFKLFFLRNVVWISARIEYLSRALWLTDSYI